MRDNFNLEYPNHYDFFITTDNTQTYEVLEVGTDNFIPYHDHPFKLYEGERFNDMVQSIRNNGLFSPIIVRPLQNDPSKYEILSGHNRFEASKRAGLEMLPCVVKKNLTDDEAHLIVTESNLIQRSFADLSHSERAISLSAHYNALKKQGKRNDLIMEIEKLVLTADKPDEIQKNSTHVQPDTKTTTRDIIGEKYGLSPSNVARYLRIAKLHRDFQQLIDNRKLGLTTGVVISYLKDAEQDILLNYITDNEINIDMKKAVQLKKLSESGNFSEDGVFKVFLGKQIKTKQSKPTTFKLKRKTFKEYFNADEKEDIIENTILQALQYYFEHNKDIYRMENNNEINSR